MPNLHSVYGMSSTVIKGRVWGLLVGSWGNATLGSAWGGYGLPGGVQAVVTSKVSSRPGSLLRVQVR